MNFEWEKIYLTSNGFNNVKHNAEIVYGYRGNFEYNLDRYFRSDEFKNSGCKIANNIKDIPLISVDIIRNQILRENFFKEKCCKIIEKFDELKTSGKLNDDAYLELGGIMGICPGQCDWHETLFPHLIDLFVKNKDEGNEILNKVENNKNIIRVMADCLTDCLRGGQFIEFGDKRVWSQGYARNYFRGENAYNKMCKSSLFRGITRDFDDKLKILIEYIKQCELCLTLKKLNFVANWPFSSQIDFTAISQHYGIKTTYIDVTSDIKVALFFACCTFDAELNEWRPLREEEFKYKNSRKSVFDRGGDSRYGIIFTAPADVCNMAFEVDPKNFQTVPVVPIGVQPFNRCDAQSAYVLEVRNMDFDLYQYPLFKKFKFRHSKKLCQWIFDEMEQGKKIYPNEFSSGIFEIVSKINNSISFSIEALDIAQSHFQLDLPKQEIIKKLNERGISIVPNPNLFSNQELTNYNKELEASGIQHFEKLSQYLRFCFCL